MGSVHSVSIKSLSRSNSVKATSVSDDNQRDNQETADKFLSTLQVMSECISKLQHNREELCAHKLMKNSRTPLKQSRVSMNRKENSKRVSQKEAQEMSGLAKSREKAIQATCTRTNERSANLKVSAKVRLKASKK